MTTKPSFGEKCADWLISQRVISQYLKRFVAHYIDGLHAQEGKEKHTCSFDLDGSPCHVCGKTFAQTWRDLKDGEEPTDERAAEIRG